MLTLAIIVWGWRKRWEAGWQGILKKWEVPSEQCRVISDQWKTWVVLLPGSTTL